MKKLRMILALIMALALIMVCTVALPVLADTGEDFMDSVMETVLQIAATLLVTLIGVLGTWLASKVGKSKHFQNISTALYFLTDAAKDTVFELQQLFVDKWKAESENGKLTEEQIADLRDMLYSRTIDKMSAPALSLLRAAQVDIDAVITGAGESLIKQFKPRNPDPI